MPVTWVLPCQTHLIGQGDNPSSGTTLQAVPTTSSFSGSAMIQFGNSSCSDISVENLNLDGLGWTINGILNQYSGSNTYVDHVSLYQILGTGLSISSTSANNSGPYSHITFNTGSFDGDSSTVCASINGTTGTQGIRDLSCAAGTNAESSAAVLLDAPNNSLEDVRIMGFYDGIRVGANAAAESNVLINIVGDTNPPHFTATPVNTVHISSNNTVADLSVMNASYTGTAGTYTIEDDLTGVHISDNSVAMYALGEKVNGGYARFTTSPSVPTWASGTGTPPSSTTCAQGSLYSCTGATSMACGGYALYGCPHGTGWLGIM